MKILYVFVLLFLLGCTQQLDKSMPAPEVYKEPITEETMKPEPEGNEHVFIPEKDTIKKPTWSPLLTNIESCEEKTIEFTTAPIDINYITAIEPQGELTDNYAGHIIPGDHVGIKYLSDGPALSVRAMADGYIVRIEKQPKPKGFGTAKEVNNYHVYFEYSCSLFGSYVHVTEFAPEIANADTQLKELVKKEVDQTTSVWPRIPIKAGQAIGEVEGFGLLGILTVDTNITLRGFINQSFYNEAEPWKIHSVPPFNYFKESIRSQLIAKNPRKKEPIGGKIDFDIDSRLVGNWFLNGTSYSGNVEPAYCGDYLCPYWGGHLAFVYDFVDPDQIRVSIGYDSGIVAQSPYGVKGNNPDPKTISPSSGIVAYELVSLENKDADFGITTYGKPLFTSSSNNVVGKILVQMIDNRTIKIEVFHDDIGHSFTEKARVYIR